MTFDDGFMYLAAFNSVLAIEVLGGEPELVDQIGLQARTDAMRADDGYLYLNLHDGNTQTIDIHDPYQPLVLGAHDVQDWVRGLHVSGNGVIRVVEGEVEMASMP
jgi:hypothetical protein